MFTIALIALICLLITAIVLYYQLEKITDEEFREAFKKFFEK